MRGPLACNCLILLVASGAACRRELVVPRVVPEAPDARPRRTLLDGPPSLPGGADPAAAGTDLAPRHDGDAAPDGPSDRVGGAADFGLDREPLPDRPADLRPPDRAIDLLPAIPERGLVAHWPFDEGEGTRAGDATGNGNHAQLNNGARWERSRVARAPADFAVRLDGQDDYLAATVGARVPRIEGAKTIGFWFAADPAAPPSSGVTGQRTCVALVNPTLSSGIQVGVDRDRPAAWGWAENQGLVIAGAPLGTGVHHLAYTFDGSIHRLYLDGAPVDSSTAASQAGPPSILYVGTYTPPNELCAGQIDDLRIYDRPLEAAEIALLGRTPAR